MGSWSEHREHREPEMTDDQADRVMDVLADHRPSVSAGADRIAVTMNVEAGDVQRAAVSSLSAIRGALSKAGGPAARPVRSR
jgi:hypothetical protein